MSNEMTKGLSPKQIALVLARVEYQQTYITKSKSGEDDYAKEHWRTFHYKARAVKKYLQEKSNEYSATGNPA